MLLTERSNSGRNAMKDKREDGIEIDGTDKC